MHLRIHRTAIALAGFALAACARRDPPARPPAPVVVAAAVRDRLPVDLAAVGHVESMQTVAVRARIGGQLLSVHFREGDSVQTGQLLFVIEPRPFEAALAEARANLARDEASAANAARELARFRTLAAQGLVSAQELDARRTNAAATRAAVRADRAAVHAALVRLGYTRITSPIDGRTGSLQITRGNTIKADDITPLVVIRQISPIYVTFSIPAGQLDAVRTAARRRPLIVSARSPDAPPDREAPEGTLTFIDNAVNTATGTILLKASFPNADRALWPGEFVNATLHLDAVETIAVPAAAVVAGQQGDSVFVVRGDLTVEQRPVRTGVRARDRIAVLRGLAAGERVVTDGQLGLAPGMKVQIKQDETPSANHRAAANPSDPNAQDQPDSNIGPAPPTSAGPRP